MSTSRRFAAAAALAAAIGSGIVFAPPAAAAAECTAGYTCLHYNSHYQGGIYKQWGQVSDYAGKTYVASTNGSAGAGQTVKNNAASVNSFDYNREFTVYYNRNFNCEVACQTIGVAGAQNLNASLKNNNASGRPTGI
ncbi:MULTISPECIES: hypothetical protein [Streptomyces]|uniref:hypothetical protein n=1 Tax=Streptomyces rubiginosohelvolus TaxID=67362 RepID=UPI0033B3A507